MLHVLKEILVCEIGIILVFICQKLGLVMPIQQKT